MLCNSLDCAALTARAISLELGGLRVTSTTPTPTAAPSAVLTAIDVMSALAVICMSLLPTLVPGPAEHEAAREAEAGEAEES